MFLHLSLSACITDRLSSLPSSWKAPSLPSGWRPNLPSSWKGNGRSYLNRLPALRISNVLSTSADTSSTTEQLSSPTRSRILWDQSVAFAKRLADMWTMAIAAQRAWQVTSYQSLARLGLFKVVQEIEADLLNMGDTIDSESDIELDAAETELDILRFVEAAGLDELQMAKMLADLSDMAYDVGKVTAERLATAYGLHLVTTSLNIRAGAHAAKPSWATPAASQQPNPTQQPSKQQSIHQQRPSTPPPSPTRTSSNIVPAPQHWKEMRSNSPARSISPARSRSTSPSKTRPEPGPAVQLQVPMPACSSCTHAHAGRSCPGFCHSTSTTLDTSIAEEDFQAAAAAAFAQESLTALEHELAATEQPQQKPQPAAEASSSSSSSDAFWPAHWFVCDDATSSTRYILVQGSVTVDHWRINLQIDPVPFEDPSLGIKVHRGMYQAAQVLYEQLLPTVQQYIAAHPTGKLCFAGHSLGGSLATLVMALLVHRGVLRPENVAPVHTFGAPAVFCHGAGSYSPPESCNSCQLSCQVSGRNTIVPHPQGGLLSLLGLPAGSVRNIIMHRDIVPRAFMCDYTIVADLLQSWVPSFKAHTGLAAHHSHKVLYTFIGDVQVLQPSAGLSFVRSDEDHSMLPAGANLYKLVQPLDDTCSILSSSDDDGEGQQGPSRLCECPRHQQMTVSDAMLAFMNSPHPIETLSDPRAYGHHGIISRYHNPVNYALALAALL